MKCYSFEWVPYKLNQCIYWLFRIYFVMLCNYELRELLPVVLEYIPFPIVEEIVD